MTAPMMDDLLARLLAWIQTWGIWLSWLAWFTVFFGALVMARVTHGLWRRDIRNKALTIIALAVVAHLADYIVTLYRSPDLSLEMNPLWVNIVRVHGLTIAKWYGLTGKLLVSLLAGQMTAFYLAHREQLFPRAAATTLAGFLSGLGTRGAVLGERLRNLFTVFAFFFAGLTFFYFYIALQNWIVDPALIERLPSVPVAVGTYVALLCIAFVVLTRRAYLRADAPPARAAAQGSEA